MTREVALDGTPVIADTAQSGMAAGIGIPPASD